MTEAVSPARASCAFPNRNHGSVTIEIDHSRDALMTDFGLSTVQDRYLLPGETTQLMFGRVAGWFAKDAGHAQRMYDAISNMWFMPSTPILSNGGTDRGLPISCFLNAVPDSMDGIRDTWMENVDLASHGGGIGTYWGDVRSLKEAIKGRGQTSGVIPFIKVMDSLTLAVSQGSLRRGSAAVYLDVHHPEIEEFINIRKVEGDANRRSLNIHHGVNITDAFMEAVIAGKDFDLISPKDGSVRSTISARKLFIDMLERRVETGEPYMVFIDTVNRRLPELYKALGLKVRQSNLCSEIALATGMDYMDKQRTAVCCLGSYNIATMDDWFGHVPFVKDVLYFLDEVIQDFIDRTDGIRGFENARYAAEMERSIGAGYMGYVTYLQSKMIPFEGAVAEGVNRKVTGWVKKVSDEINLEAAVELGPNKDSIMANKLLGEAMAPKPVRWSNMLAVAPTASISIICATVSPSFDLWPANIFTQKTLSGTFTVRNVHLDRLLNDRFNERNPLPAELECEPCANQFRDESRAKFVAEAWKSILEAQGSCQHLDFLTQEEKDVFKTAFETDQKWVIHHAQVRAPNICQMASNNIFLPPDVSKAELYKLHVSAWRNGVPSLYYLRSKSIQRAGIGVSSTNVAGEMPQPREVHEAKLFEGDVVSPEIEYESCLACQ